MPDVLVDLFAFPVTPGQPPQGGRAQIGEEIRTALDESYVGSKVSEGLAVAFNVDTTTRTNEVRDAAILICFGNDVERERAANYLSHRLSDSMDKRSKPGLLILSSHGRGANRSLVLWTFPQDEVFRFEHRAGQERVAVLDDVFSRSSNLRKAAEFSGRNAPTGFLTGRVVDYQANASERYVADFWVERFLDARLQMSGREGTRLFAKVIKQAFTDLEGDVVAQEQLGSAVNLVRNREQRMSLDSFAYDFLDASAASAIRENAPNEASVRALFDFNPYEFQRIVRFRTFVLDSGVTVTAPLDGMEDVVDITQDGEARRLSTAGLIVDETIKARRG